MRNLNDVACRFLDVRTRWQHQIARERELADADILAHEAAIAARAITTETLSAAELERELTTLAWVLGVDPDIDQERLHARALMQQLSQGDHEPPAGPRATQAGPRATQAGPRATQAANGEPTQVTLSIIRRYPHWLWLAEFPALSESGYTTGYWAAFIAPRQLRELGVAIAKRFGSLGGNQHNPRPTRSLAAYIATERGTTERGTTEHVQGRGQGTGATGGVTGQPGVQPEVQP